MAQEQPSAEESDLYHYIDLRRARLCLDCEMIFDSPQQCPACASKSFVPVTRWIRPTERRVVERREALVPVPAVAPPRPSKPRQLLKKSLYVGLGAYGVWKMLFQPSKPRAQKLPKTPKTPEA